MPTETIDTPTRSPIVDPSLPLASFVFETLGAASVCWEDMSGTGMFFDQRAKQLGDELLLRIAETVIPDDDFLWRVTYAADKPINVEAGELLSKYQDAGVHAIGEMLIKLGTRLMGSTITDDDDDKSDYLTDEEKALGVDGK